MRRALVVAALASQLCIYPPKNVCPITEGEDRQVQNALQISRMFDRANLVTGYWMRVAE